MTAPTDRDLLRQAADALAKCATAALTVKPELNTPYADRPEWTPYTRWVERPADEATELAARIREHLTAESGSRIPATDALEQIKERNEDHIRKLMLTEASVARSPHGDLRRLAAAIEALGLREIINRKLSDGMRGDS